MINSFYLLTKKLRVAKKKIERRFPSLHTKKSVPNLVITCQIWSVITLSRLSWHQTDIHLVPNQSKKRNYNPNLI